MDLKIEGYPSKTWAWLHLGAPIYLRANCRLEKIIKYGNHTFKRQLHSNNVDKHKESAKTKNILFVKKRFPHGKLFIEY